MLIYRCPRGHLYGIGGYGEDLVAMSNGVPPRPGRMHDCPACLAEFGPHGPPFPGREPRVALAREGGPPK